MSSPQREAARRAFERPGPLNMTAIAKLITETIGPYSRQAVQKEYRKWRAEPGNENLGSYVGRLKAPPVPRQPTTQPADATAQLAPQSATESQQRPLGSMAARRANAREIIFAGLRMGMYRRHAVARSGMTLNSFYAWMQDPDFAAAVAAAEADAIADVNAALYEDATKGKLGQRAVPAAIFLERRHGAFYGRNARVQVEVEHRGTIDMKRVITSDSALNAAAAYEMALQGEVIEGEVLPSLPEHVEVDE